MKKLACGFVLALSLHAGVTRGADWTFNMKIDVSSIHPDGKLFAHCYVSPVNEFVQFGNTDQLEAQVEVPLQNHAFHGTVAVPLSSPAGKDPNIQKYWQCGLRIFKTPGVAAWPTQDASTPVWARAKSGVPFKPYLSGPLP
jgi:hypothetical protein